MKVWGKESRPWGSQRDGLSRKSVFRDVTRSVVNQLSITLLFMYGMQCDRSFS